MGVHAAVAMQEATLHVGMKKVGAADKVAAPGSSGCFDDMALLVVRFLPLVLIVPTTGLEDC